MRGTKSIRKNSLIYMVRTLMNVLFPLITFKYASGVIKASGIGAANFSSAIIGYVGLISSLGISAYAISEGSKIRKKRNELACFVSEVFTINLCSMTFSYCILGILLICIEAFQPYRVLILIYSSTILFSALGMEWFFTIEEKFEYITIRSIIIQAISLVLLFILVRNEGDVPWYVMLTAVSSAGSCVFNFIYSRKSLKISISPLANCKKHLKPIFIIWAANVASLIYVNADTIIIGLIQGDAAIGYYSAGVKIVKAICIPIGSLSVVAGPQLAEAIAENNKREINRISMQVLEFMSFFAFPCIVGLFLLGKESILLISGEEFLPGLMAERILLVDIILSPLNGFIANQIMIPIHEEKRSMIAMIIAAVANIILDFILIEAIGINGAAIATVVSEALVLVICLPSVLRTVDLRTISSGIWKYAVSSLIVIGVYYGCSFFNFSILFNTLIVVAVSIVTYCALIMAITHRSPVSIIKKIRKKKKGQEHG